jgi:hypothetical protein
MSCFEYIFLTYIVKVADRQFRRFAASEIYVNGVEFFISEYYRTTFSLAVPQYTARFSGVFTYVETPGDEVGNTKNMPMKQLATYVTVSCLGYISCLTGLRSVYERINPYIEPIYMNFITFRVHIMHR